jgi:hypothetical protein
VIDKVSQEEFQQKQEELNEQPTQQEDENKSQKEEQPKQVGTNPQIIPFITIPYPHI